jgi:Rrf2 family protein
MKFSTKTTYGLRALIALANNWPNKSLSLNQIAKNENISLKYLEKIFATLKQAKLIKAEKGVAGGYKLAKAPSAISTYEII